MNSVTSRRIRLSVLLIGGILIQTPSQAQGDMITVDGGSSSFSFTGTELPFEESGDPVITEIIPEPEISQVNSIELAEHSESITLEPKSSTSPTSPSIFPEDFPQELKFMVLSLTEPKDLQALDRANKGCSRDVNDFVWASADCSSRAFNFFKQHPSTWQLNRLYQLNYKSIQDQVLKYLQTWPCDPTFSSQVRTIEERTFEQTKDRRSKRYIENHRNSLPKLFKRAEIPFDKIIKIVSSLSKDDLKTIYKNPDTITFKQKLLKEITKFYNLAYSETAAKQAFQYIDCLLLLSPDEKKVKPSYITSGINMGYKVLGAESNPDLLKSTYQLMTSYFDQLLILLSSDDQNSATITDDDDALNLEDALHFYDNAIDFFQAHEKDQYLIDFYKAKKAHVQTFMTPYDE
ncbi:MAG TPA: hypothetical protein VNJ29_02220 [Candidatus Nitrosotenuis sp.]|nr:hypothetical protein [Candidatus Nitrosotenuis sp.]